MNSLLPFVINVIWAIKAKRPPKLNIKENISPAKVCWDTKTNPYRTKNTSGKCSIRNPVIPPGMWNSPIPSSRLSQFHDLSIGLS